MQRILFFSNSGAGIQKGRSQPKPALQLAMQRMLQRYSWRTSERALLSTSTSEVEPANAALASDSKCQRVAAG